MGEATHQHWRSAINEMRAAGFYRIARRQNIGVELNDVQIWAAQLPDVELLARLDELKALQDEQFSARGIASFFGVDTVLANFGLWPRK